MEPVALATFVSVREDLALPSAVRGPVERSHGFHRWINSAQALQRSWATFSVSWETGQRRKQDSAVAPGK